MVEILYILLQICPWALVSTEQLMSSAVQGHYPCPAMRWAGQCGQNIF